MFASPPVDGRDRGAIAQTPTDAAVFEKLGRPVDAVCGNLKFDVVLKPELATTGRAWREAAQAEQVVLFAHHKAVLAALLDGLRDHRVGVIDGSVAPKERQALSNRFQSGGLRVMIVSSAGREGLDLYASSHLIMVERLWTTSR